MIEKLISWSEENYSKLPWRVNRTPYTTLVSEIMLQQTTVSTVQNHFDRFLLKYPDVLTLANTSEEQILIDWKGLGYYRRAKNLLKAAKDIQEKFNNRIPSSYEDLIEIDGIGPYTANAILSIGLDKPALALDANLERVLSRLHGIAIEKGIKLQKELQKKFEDKTIAQDIHLVGGRKYNEALMDLGRSICMARKAYCEICPLSKECIARSENKVLEYPVQKKMAKKKLEDLHLVRFVIRKGDKVLSYKKSNSEWLSGQYEIPTFVLYSENDSFSQYPKIENEDLYNLPSFKTAITHHKITNYTCEIELKDFERLVKRKYEFRSILDGNLSTASSKAINL